MSTQPIKVAILAMGGEGGGVLADWIVDLGEHNGFLAQTTSVPGVAQRTGATIYYVELFDQAQAERDGAVPVLALMPMPGDVDVVLASELMEAGRAVQRGLVTPDRSTLIASTHRVYAMNEKTVMGDGRVDSDSLLGHAREAAKRLIAFDMEQAADQAGSVLSAVLFGALAGSACLPFSRAQFEATIERGGVGVKSSLRAFSDGFERGSAAIAAIAVTSSPAPSAAVLPSLRKASSPAVQALLDRVAREFPLAAQSILVEGLRRTIDYQDVAYAALYLDRVKAVAGAVGVSASAARESVQVPAVMPLDAPAQPHEQLVIETARHLALWMSYEDTVRVADLKTRDARFERVRKEVRSTPEQLLTINEYLHPRLQEICDTLPAGLGRWLARSGWPRRLVERFAARGRVIATSSLRGFLLLWLVAGLRRFRRSSLRFQVENERIELWLREIAQTANQSVALATEIARCQRLVKGYGDTHERGLRNFELLRSAWRNAGTQLSPATLAELRNAALADEHGVQLQSALVRHSLA